ncbi:PLP-dependent aminotransferase family protein [Xanthobacter autotrophicus]|uniref:aminotransferase-like domain-containing protein n=1 Tax=Xanthobacter autotrophicus TaxID=280 RepID=UPI0024A62A5B|nr:PLP-dependent aminotransferase family protein [Xanthobacter autotrophicus]MDI4658837.1 PLP-dependent aminotransferase family protein [Xanthobacter autotrophicus]
MSIALNPFIAGIPANPLRALFPFAARPGMLNLASGHPSRDAYDHAGLAEALPKAGADFPAWTYGPSAGDPLLLEALQEHLAEVPAGHRLLVTSGAQQGIDLAIRTLAPPGAAVLVPEPVYPAVLSACAAVGVRTVGYRTDAADTAMAGLAAALAATPDVRALYALPTFGNPTGETLTRTQRLAMLALCAQRGIPVIEDDPYRALWFRVPPPPSLLALAPKVPGVAVIHLGSLSKIISPGLRLGWAVAPDAVAGPMQEARQASDLQPNSLAQRVALHYLRLGRLDAHVARVRGLYAARYDALAGRLAAAGFLMPPVDGGMFVFARMPEGTVRDGLFDRAVARGVMYAPGAAFALQPGDAGFADRMRLCFVGLADADVPVAADRLVAAARG